LNGWESLTFALSSHKKKKVNTSNVEHRNYSKYMCWTSLINTISQSLLSSLSAYLTVAGVHMLTDAEPGKTLRSLYFVSLCSRDLLCLYTTYRSGVLAYPRIRSNNYNNSNSHDSGNNSPPGSPNSYMLARLMIFQLIPCSLKHLKAPLVFCRISSAFL